MRVFVSYARADADRVMPVVLGLRAANIEVWYDQQDIEPGDTFPSAIARAIREADVFLLFLSKASVRRPWLQRELAHAQDLGRRVIPVRLDAVIDVPPGLDIRIRELQSVDPERVVACVTESRQASPLRVVHLTREASPTLTLDYCARLTPLRGRDSEFRDLIEWVTSPAKGTGFRVISGPGGVGKSRLARELCHAPELEGWSVHWIYGHEDASRIAPGRSDLLVVIDYPEERTGLTRDLLKNLATYEQRVRVLLLTRLAPDSWNHLLRVTNAHRGQAKPIVLQPFAPESEVATALFNDVRRKLAEMGKHSAVSAQQAAVTAGALAQLATRDAKGVRGVTPLSISALAHVAGTEARSHSLREEVFSELVEIERKKLCQNSLDVGWGRNAGECISALATLSAEGLPFHLLETLWPSLASVLETDAGVARPTASTIERFSEWNGDRWQRPSPDILAAALGYKVLGDHGGFIGACILPVLAAQPEGLPSRLGRLIYDIGTVFGPDATTEFQSCIARAIAEASPIEPLRERDGRIGGIVKQATVYRPPPNTAPVLAAVLRGAIESPGLSAQERAVTLTHLGHLLERSQPQEARTCLDDALELWTSEELLGRDALGSGAGKVPIECTIDFATTLHICAAFPGPDSDPPAQARLAVELWKKALAAKSEPTLDERLWLVRVTHNLGLHARDSREAIKSYEEAALECLEILDEAALKEDLFQRPAAAAEELLGGPRIKQWDTAALDLLGQAMANRARALWGQHQAGDAIAAMRLAVGLRRRAVDRDLSAYASGLDVSLGDLAEWIAQTDGIEAAIDILKERVDRLELLAAAVDPVEYGPRLAAAVMIYLSAEGATPARARAAVEALLRRFEESIDSLPAALARDLTQYTYERVAGGGENVLDDIEWAARILEQIRSQGGDDPDIRWTVWVAGLNLANGLAKAGEIDRSIMLLRKFLHDGDEMLHGFDPASEDERRTSALLCIGHINLAIDILDSADIDAGVHESDLALARLGTLMNTPPTQIKDLGISISALLGQLDRMSLDEHRERWMNEARARLDLEFPIIRANSILRRADRLPPDEARREPKLIEHLPEAIETLREALQSEAQKEKRPTMAVNLSLALALGADLLEDERLLAEGETLCNELLSGELGTLSDFNQAAAQDNYARLLLARAHLDGSPQAAREAVKQLESSLATFVELEKADAVANVRAHLARAREENRRLSDGDE